MDIQENRGVILSVVITADTLNKSIKKMENFTRLVGKLSEDGVCTGIVSLDISAKID